jgi:hypothetical protein
MPKTEAVKIKTRSNPPKSTTVNYTFAQTLDEAKDWYGEELCYKLINKAIKVGAQAAGRPLLAADKPQEEIQAAVSAFKPDLDSRRGRVKYIADMDTLKEQFATMPQAEKAQMLAMFEAYLRGEEVAPGTGTEENDEDDENGDDDDDEDAEPPSPTESPPANINRAQQRKRGPRLNFD